ncbi:MAG: excinuclease ABC subunit UvrA [Paludibacteraceae bacterium]|nr:excinuclease ABC subunit UvrA [Paludibacteraceae bacterium]
MNEDVIHIHRARTHNLKDITVDIPRNKLVVISGVSGSGKSSLAFDTLFAEGQRRYVESLSSYARQFLGRMQKPDVDFIDGIPPAIAIEQKVTNRNPRSTVGTVTEIHEYLKLLFARAGKTISPVSGMEVKRHSVHDVVECLRKQPIGTKVLLLSPIVAENIEEQLGIWQQQGFARLYQFKEDGTGEVLRLNQVLTNNRDALIQQHKQQNSTTPACANIALAKTYLLVDRVIADGEESTLNRFADSVQTAFFEGKGECRLVMELPNIDCCAEDRPTGCRSASPEGGRESKIITFSQRFEADGITFMEPTEHLFDFNSPLGACPTCGGYGNVIGIDPDLVVPDKTKTIYEGAIACWKGEKMGLWNEALIYAADKFDFPIHTPYYELTAEQKQLLWIGNEHFHGLNDFFHELESKQYAKIQYRVMLSRYRGKAICPDCLGKRLRKEAEYVLVGGKSITELSQMPITQLAEWFKDCTAAVVSPDGRSAVPAGGDGKLSPFEPLLTEIRSRLQFMQDVGLGYLTLSRMSSTLSGGEGQRINLAKSLGSSLVGSLYVLDEPSIGLHPRDTQRLIHVLKQLRDLGNTIVVVEHDDEIQKAADYSIEIGPKAGRHGGELVYAGAPKIEKFTYSIPPYRRQWNNYIEVIGATENNLKNINVRFPLNVMTVVTGVSGSGKSSLITKVLYPALKKHYGGIAERTGDFGSLRGSLQLIHNVEFVDQNPLTKSSRSNPVTYLKAYDEIRKLYAEQQLSKQLGFTPSHFSFNTPGGRCEACQGEGTIRIEMQFMADIVLECEHCKGKRFKQDVLDVLYREKNIYDVLEMTVNQAIEFFAEDAACKKIVNRLKPLQDVGIGYVKLGQAGSTLSGGESQRVKLASFLAQENATPTLFIFDEPTTGLHHHDVAVLLKALNALISRGHSVLVIEHNPSVILAADHIIDLGPEGGDEGGRIVAEGTPEQIMECADSYTGRALNELKDSFI